MFNKANFDKLDALKTRLADRAFLALVCVKAKEVCILSVNDFYKSGRNEKPKKAPWRTSISYSYSSPLERAFACT